MPTPEEIAAEKAAAEKKAADEAAAAEAAKKAAGNGNGNTDPNAGREDKWDPETKKYIESLRAENAKARTEKKELSSRLDKLEGGLKTALGIDDKSTPEEKIESLKAQTEAQNFKSAILEAAIENGIGKDQIDYFQFLVEKAASQLEEGDEISDESMQEIVKKVKVAGGTSTNGKGGNTSVNTNGKPNPDGGDYDSLSVEQFAKLSITDKSLMYTKNPDKYASFMKQAKDKRLIV